MKIGILTFHHSLNCGAVLQAWALQTHLRKQGYNAKVINYGKIGWPGKYSLRCDSFRHFIGSLYKWVNTFFTTFAIESYRRHLYWKFLRKQMQLGRVVKKAEINRCNHTHLIVGSDQVWHPIINEGDDTYFLANAPDGAKRISYAPSFGVDQFGTELERKMSVWLSHFNSLSVRERQGAEIVKRLCGRDATVVCDPTLLLSRYDYEAIECKPLFDLPEKYIAVYTICGHPWAEDVAVKLGKNMGMPVVHVIGGQLARWHLPGEVKRLTALGPAEWLWFMHHAEYVITNSFHGTVFALIYHKPFVVALNGKASDDRMRSLLGRLGLAGRLMEDTDAFDGSAPIEWCKLDSYVMHLADEGKKFLDVALT